MICPECLGCGWRPYFVETVEDEVGACLGAVPGVRGGEAFPSEEGGQPSAPSSLSSS
jgi:hypothetical protein